MPFEPKPFPQQILTPDAFNSLLGALFEAVPEGILIVDASSDILFMNRQMIDLWGFTAGISVEEARKNVLEKVKEPEKFYLRVDEIYANKETVLGEKVRFKNGKLYLRKTKPLMINGNYEGHIWMYRDITDEHYEKMLFENIFEHAPIGMSLNTADGTFLNVNQAFIDTLGYDKSELLKNNFGQYTHPSDLESSQSMVKGLTTSDKTSAHLEKRYIHKNSSVIDASVHLKKLPNRNEDEAYFLAQIVDLTERKKAEKALFQHQKLESIGVLAAGIAHDFNNLLVAIKAQADIATRKLEQGINPTQHIGKIQAAANSAAYLTEQLLAYSGQRQFKAEDLDINEEIVKSTSILDIAIPKNILFKKHLSTKRLKVSAEKGQIQQIILNLIINAAESMEGEPGVITLTTQPVEFQAESLLDTEDFVLKPQLTGKHVAIYIRDTGSGMDGSTQSKIFDPFFTTKFTGRGLGLAAVLGIIRSHKGALQIKSELEVGTTFGLFFPAFEEKGDYSATVSKRADSDLLPANANKEKDTVLLIDDDELICEALVDLFALEEVNLICATDGQHGIDKFALHQNKIALILLDLSMPGKSSFDTFTELKSMAPLLPILLCSGYSKSKVSDLFAGKSFEGFIPKPFAIDDLVAKVKIYL